MTRIRNRPTALIRIIFSAFFVVATSWILPNTAGAAKTEPEEHYEDARVRFDKSDYAGAIVRLKTALQKNPSNLPARLLLGEAYLATDDYASAEKELTRARGEGADEALVLVPLAKSYMRLRKYERLLSNIQRGDRGSAIESEILLLRGKAHLALNQLDEAQRTLSEAARSRTDGAAYLAMAHLQLKRKDTEAAKELVGAALNREAENAEAWFLSGDIKRLHRDLEGAAEDFAKAIKLDPQNEIARTAHAGILIDLGRHKEAEPDILFLREKSPWDPTAAYFHALVLNQSGKTKEAQLALDQASNVLSSIDTEKLVESPPAVLLAGIVAYFRNDLEAAYGHLNRHVNLAPENVTSRRILGTILLQRNDAKQAMTVLEPALALAPKNLRILRLLGTALMQTKQYARAAEILQRTAALAPENAEIQTNLGAAWLNSGQDNAATTALKNAIQLNPEEKNAPVMLSLIQMKQGNFKEALVTAQALAKQDPKNPFAYNMIGSAQVALGNLAEGRAGFEQALKLDSDYVPPRLNMAKLELRLGNVAAGEALYREIVKISETNTRAMVALAKIAASKGETKQAIRWLEKASSIDQSLIEEQFNLARLHMETDKPNSAVRVLSKLVQVAPQNLSALEALALAELATGARETAIKTFNRLSGLAQAQKQPSWLVRSARHLVRLDDFKNATAALETALILDRKFLPAHGGLFNLEVRLGRFEEARRRARILKLDFPSNPIGVTLQGDLEMRQNRFYEASQTYASGFKEFPSADLLIRLYRAQRAAGRAKKAINLLEDWVTKNPQDNAVKRTYAAALMEIKSDKESLALHEALLSETPDDPAILNNLALLHQRSGDSRALAFAEKAYKHAPKQAGPIDTYGWILVQNGRAKEGLELLRSAQARAPHVTEIKYHIAVALHRLGREKDARRALEAILTKGGEFDGQAAAHALWLKLSGR